MIETLLPEGVSLLFALLLIGASFFTAGLTAAAGVGGGLLMLALMTYLIPLAALIPVHGLVQLGSNAGRTYVQRDYISWNTTKYFLIGSLLGALIGVWFVTEISEGLFQLLLGFFIGITVWMSFPALRQAGRKTVMSGGLVTTFISMFAGATGPLVAVFLNNMFDTHRRMVATHAATMTAQHGVKILAFGLAGFAFWEWVPLVEIGRAHV